MCINDVCMEFAIFGDVGDINKVISSVLDLIRMALMNQSTGTLIVLCTCKCSRVCLAA